MKMARKVHFAAASVLTLCLAACSSKPAQMDYTAFKEAKPRSILVLPPINHTSSVNAPYGLLSQMTHPLAEGGYYVVPVAMELETFHQNGVPMPDEMAQIPAEKLRAIFGADAVLYSTVTSYGSHYGILDSVTTVELSAKLVDLRTGSVIWSGSAEADDRDRNNNGNNIIGKLIGAAIKQIGNTISDSAYPVAGVASERLLATGNQNGWLLYGPRSPYYDTK